MFFDSNSATIHSSVYIYLHLMKWFLSSFLRLFFFVFISFRNMLVSKNGSRGSKRAKNARPNRSSNVSSRIRRAEGETIQYSSYICLQIQSQRLLRFFFCSFLAIIFCSCNQSHSSFHKRAVSTTT